MTTYLGIPELGTVPSAIADPMHYRRFGPLSPAHVGAGESLELITLQRKPSAMAEAVRATLTSILFRATHGEHPQVIVMSSAAPKEGKTTLCTNLAIALSEIHGKVLLIDADLRKPRMHKIFELDNEEGLVDILRRTEPFTALNGEVMPTAVPNLSVLTAGRSKDGDTTLLHSNRLTELLKAAREKYDTVVIDTPPMLTMADARVIAKHADAVVLVARAQQTSREGLREAYERFLSDGTNVLGAVLNDWNPKRSNRYGYYRYYDRYKHYYDNGRPA